MTIDSGSTRSSMGARKEPTEIHSKSITDVVRPSWPAPRRSMKISSATTNDPPTSSDASPPAIRRSGLPATISRTAPASGSAGTSQMRSVIRDRGSTRGACPWPATPLADDSRGPRPAYAALRSGCEMTASPSEDVDVVDAGGHAPAEDGHDDGQTDHHLGRRHDHGEEGQDLSADLAQLPGERDQRQVDRVQLELDRHEDHQGVPPDQDADRADREQDRRENQVIADRCPHRRASS